MTGFDNIMRSQQFAAQERQFYDAQRYQSDRQAGQSLMQGAGMAIDAYQQAQAMEMQKVQVESDLRLQEAVMEDQFHKNKLNTMLMMDQVDMSRIGVKQAQLQYDMGKRQYEEFEKNQQDTLEYRRGQLNASMLPYLQRQGETIGADGKRRPMTDQEKADYAKGAGRGRQGGLTADNLMRMANELRQRYTTQFDGFDVSRMTETDKAMWQNVNRQLAEMFGVQQAAQIMGVDPGTALEDQGMSSLTLGEAASMIPGMGTVAANQGAAGAPAGKPARSIPQPIQQFGAQALAELPPGAVEAFGPNAKGIGIALGAVAEAMVRSGQLPPGTAGRHIGQQMLGANNLDLLAYVLSFPGEDGKGFSPDQIRALVIKRLIDDGRADPEKAADAIMDRSTDYMERILKERGEVPAAPLPYDQSSVPQELPPGFDFDSFNGGGK